MEKKVSLSMVLIFIFMLFLVIPIDSGATPINIDFEDLSTNDPVTTQYSPNVTFSQTTVLTELTSPIDTLDLVNLQGNIIVNTVKSGPYAGMIGLSFGIPVANISFDFATIGGVELKFSGYANTDFTDLIFSNSYVGSDPGAGILEGHVSEYFATNIGSMIFRDSGKCPG